MEKKCELCGCMFIAIYSRNKFCSKECCEKNRKEYQKEYKKQYQKLDKHKEYQKEYKKRNIYKKYHKKYQKEYQKCDKYKEYQKQYKKQYQKLDKHKEYQKEYREDIEHKLRKNIVSRMCQYVKNKNKLALYLGCSMKFLKQHLEKQFKPWMTWDNYGKYKKETFKYGWDMDHIIPLSSAKTDEELIKLFHYTNIQPLDSHINRDIKKNTHDKNYKTRKS